MWPQLWPRCLRFQCTNSPCMITMYGHFICKPQIIYLKHISFHWKKYQVKAHTQKKINDTPPHCCNRNDACWNIKHQQSLPKNEQNSATTKLLLTCYGSNKQSRRDAVTTAMVPGPWIRELGIKFDCGRITGFATMLQHHIKPSTYILSTFPRSTCRGVSWLSRHLIDIKTSSTWRQLN